MKKGKPAGQDSEYVRKVIYSIFLFTEPLKVNTHGISSLYDSFLNINRRELNKP